MRWVALASGVVLAPLGGLWLLQGLGIVRLQPILCFADCSTIQGPSFIWAAVGVVSLAAGSVAMWWSQTTPAG